MNIIEKLESFQQQLIGVGQTAAACDLQNIIEEYKNAQEPVCFARPDDVDMKTYPDLAFNSPVRSKKGGEFTQPLFTHPPLSDETVKDAERYKFIAENKYVPWGSILQQYDVNEIGIDAAIDEAMKASK